MKKSPLLLYAQGPRPKQFRARNVHPIQSRNQGLNFDLPLKVSLNHFKVKFKTSDGDRICRSDSGINDPMIASRLVISSILDVDLATVNTHRLLESREWFNWLGNQVPYFLQLESSTYLLILFFFLMWNLTLCAGDC